MLINSSPPGLREENKKLKLDRDDMMGDLERALRNREKLSDLKSMVEKKMSCQPRPVIFTK